MSAKCRSDSAKTCTEVKVEGSPPYPPREARGRGQYPEEFERFWSAYPRSRHIGKGAALKAWTRHRAIRPPIEAIIRVLAALKKTDQWTRDNGQFIPHPATWLNRAGWDDEPPVQSADQSGCGDLMRLRTDNGPANMAAVKHMSLNLIRNINDKASIRARRKALAWETNISETPSPEHEPCFQAIALAGLSAPGLRFRLYPASDGIHRVRAVSQVRAVIGRETGSADPRAPSEVTLNNQNNR